MHPNTRNLIVIFWLCIFCIALFNRGANLTFDDANYLQFAQQIMQGSFSLAQSPYAYGFLLPLTIAISYTIFGINALAASLPAMIEYIIIVLCIYKTISKFYDPNISLLVTSFTAGSPFLALYSARVLPDMLIGTLVSLALYYYFTKPKDTWHTFATGMLAGLTIYVKLGGFAFTSLILLLFVLKDKEHWKAYLLGIALPIVTYLLVMATNTGSFSFIAQYSQEQVKLTQATLPINLGTMLTFIGNYNTSAPAFAQAYPLGLLFILAIAGSLFAIKDRDKGLMLCYGLLWLSFFYLLFGTESLSAWTYITVESRYFIFLALPIAMLAGYAISIGYNLIKIRYSQRLASYFLIGLIALFLLSNAPIYWWQLTHIIQYGGTPSV